MKIINRKFLEYIIVAICLIMIGGTSACSNRAVSNTDAGLDAGTDGGPLEDGGEDGGNDGGIIDAGNDAGTDGGSVTDAGMQKVAIPIFDPAPGVYTSAQNVTVWSVTLGATSRCTTDQTTPTCETAECAFPVPVTATTTLKAISCKTGWEPSLVNVGTYTITGKVDAPVFDPVPGTYTTAQVVTITSATLGATLHCATNEMSPACETPECVSPLTISATTTLKAIACKTGWEPSSLKIGTYTITGKVAEPSFDPAPGKYTTPKNVTVTSATPGATIHCTTDFSPPECSTAECASPVFISQTTEVRAIACKPGWETSSEALVWFTIGCSGFDDFTLCEVFPHPIPYYVYNICTEEVCVMPGCGNVDCNPPGPHFILPPAANLASNYDKDTSTGGEPVVIDKTTRLYWQGCAAGNTGDDCSGGSAVIKTWEEALDYCNTLHWGNHTDWRLPDIDELISIVDYGITDPAMDRTAFPTIVPYTINMDFWSLSTSASNTDDAWGLDFIKGEVRKYGKTAGNYVRCVAHGN